MKNFQNSYKQLNENQKKAVDTINGPVLVIAGPGTGKTQVLALRIVNLILSEKVKPEKILALTFSESAVNSMKNRIREFIGSISYDIDIKTFHSFCNDIILEYPEKFKFTDNLIQIDELKKNKIIKHLIRKNRLEKLKPFGDTYHYKNDILRRISELKKEGINPKLLAQFLEKWDLELKDKLEENINPRTNKPKVKFQNKLNEVIKNKDLLLIYKNYLDYLRDKGFYDFDDMILWVLEALKTDQEIKDVYQEKYDFILSDEFQDTNSSQNELIEILLEDKESPNLFVVGDEDQSIYRFQGANLSNILFLEKKYPSLKVIPINVNYRSNQYIVNNANHLIKNNTERITNFIKNINKEIKSHKEVKESLSSQARQRRAEEEKIRLYKFSDSDIEKFFLQAKIKELHERGVGFNDIAIIVRTNQEVEEIAEYLIKSDIPVEMISQRSILNKQSLKDFIYLLKTVNNLNNNQNLHHLLSSDFLSLDPKDFLLFTTSCFEKKEKLINFYLNQFDEIKGKLNEPEKIQELFEKLITFKKESLNLPEV